MGEGGRVGAGNRGRGERRRGRASEQAPPRTTRRAGEEGKLFIMPAPLHLPPNRFALSGGCIYANCTMCLCPSTRAFAGTSDYPQGFVALGAYAAYGGR